MKRITIIMLALLLAVAMLPLSAFAASRETSGSPPDTSGGRLVISEAGTYTLTGSMRGSVWVDPGAGQVELILDNVTIDGAGAPAIQAVSGDQLNVTMVPGSRNSVTDGSETNAANAAVLSQIPVAFSGEGRLNITGMAGHGISAPNACIAFISGWFSISAPQACISSAAPAQIGHTVTLFENGNLTAGFAPAVSRKDDSDTTTQQASVPTETRTEENTEASAASQQSDPTPQADQQTVAWQPDSQQPAPDQMGMNGMDSRQSDASGMPAMPGMNGSSGMNDPAGMNNNSGISGMAPPDMGTMPQPGANDRTGLPSDQNADMSFQPGMNNGINNGMNMQNGAVSADAATEIVTSNVANTAAALEADMENAQTITVTEEDSQVKISSSGTYVVTGSASNGNITVKKSTTGVVLVLDDLDLTSTTGATLSINKEAEVKLIVSGQVVLTDAENPEDEESADAEVADAFDGAAIKIKAGSQVYLTGDGILTLNGEAKNGIKVGDEADLLIDGALNVNISAANDGINANYDLTILDGSLTIEAGDDAIHADHILTVGREDGTGPVVNVTGSNEGLEGTVVNMFGGKVSIRSTDDAINAANGDSLYEGELDYSFNMTGGEISIRSSGDGLDSNGNVNLVGGSLSIQSATVGGEAGIDYDGAYYVAQNFSLNNQSGTAGPDGMPGQMMGGMPGQMTGSMPAMNDQTTTQSDSAPEGMPSQMMGGTPGQMTGSMPAMNDQTAAQSGSAPEGMPAQMMGCMPGTGGPEMQGNAGF